MSHQQYNGYSAPTNYYPNQLPVQPQYSYNSNLYPQEQQSQSCPHIGRPSIDLPSFETFEYNPPQHNYHYSTSTESSPSPAGANSGKSKCKFPPVRKLTRASSNPNDCLTPLPTNAANGYSYQPQIHQHQQIQQPQQHQHQHFHPIAFPTYDPILSLQTQDLEKPLYDGQKRGRKPKPDDYDEEKKLAKRNYGRHYRKNKTLEALKVQEKFKTTKFYMDSIKNWANLNGCMDLAKFVEQHDKLMGDIEKYSGED